MDIDDHKKYQTLREQNSRAPSNQLPAEILIRICHMNAYRGYVPYLCRKDDEEIVTYLPPQLRDTINASQVCSHWYNIIIGAPELWRRFIDLTNPRKKWTEMLLKRSEPYSIMLIHPHSHPTQCISQKLIAKANQLRSRISEYRVRVAYDDDIDQWPTEPNAWPRLDFLCIHQNNRWDNSAHGLFLPEGMPGVATPHLRHLHLHHCIFRNITQLLSMANTLVHLTLDDLPSFQLPRITEWVDILPKLHHLRSLTLRTAPTDANNAGADQSLFNLPREQIVLELEELFLEDKLQACVRMLSCFTFPRIRFFRISCLPSIPGPDIDSIISCLSSIFASMSARSLFQTPALQLQADHIRFMGTSLDPVQSPFEPKDYPEDASAAIDVTFLSSSISSEQDVWKVFFFPLLDVFNPAFSRIRFLSIDDFNLFNRVAIINNVLFHCISLHRIESITLEIWKLLYARLMTDTITGRGSSTNEHAIILPALREIALSINDEEPPEIPHYPLYEELINLCSQRQRMGYPLQKLLHPPYRDLSEGSDLFLLDLMARLNPFDVAVVF